MDMQIFSGNTAISRNAPSVPMQVMMAQDVFKNEQVPRPRVFDLGHGLGRDMIYARERGYEVYGWDPNHYIQGFSVEEPNVLMTGKFHAVLLSYVLNVIPDPEERIETIRMAMGLTLVGGIVTVGVRTIRDIITSRTDEWTRYGDGWVTSRDTFQRGFVAAEVVSMMDRAGFWKMQVAMKSPLVVIGEKR